MNKGFEVLEEEKTIPLIIDSETEKIVLQKAAALRRAGEPQTKLERTIFQEMMLAQILPHFLNDLKTVLIKNNIDNADDIIQDITDRLRNEENSTIIHSILATPPDVRRPTQQRPGLFLWIIQQLKLAQKPVSADNIYQALKDQIAEDKEFLGGNRFVGYHTSPDCQLRSTIRGAGADDRAKNPLAYYAQDYTSLYGNKDSPFLYCVTGNTNDKNDPSRGWYWNNGASIISGPYSVAGIQKKINEYLGLINN